MPSRTPKPLPRKLHLPSGVWTYRVGGTGVQIRTPDNRTTHYVPLDKLLGEDMDDVYYARRWNEIREERYPYYVPRAYEASGNRPTLGDVTPAKVKEYVRGHFSWCWKPAAAAEKKKSYCVRMGA